MNRWLRKEPLDILPESLRLFMICEVMNFAHLPVAGGLYDQHPRLVDEWLQIWNAKAEFEAIKEAREQRKKPKGPQGR